MQDRLEMQVAAGGPSGGSHPGDHLAHLHRVTRLHANGFQVVVGGDKTVAMIDLYSVAAAPRVPARGAHRARIRGIDPGAAGGCIVLAEVEVTACSGEGADTVAKG
ncbi:hypothetical protein M1E17_03605 [Arthrobacter sp. D1-29]